MSLRTRVPRSGGSGDATPDEVIRLRASDGTRLSLHAVGPADGVPVLLVPGTFSNHSFWLGTRGTGFARHRAAAGYRAFALYPRGHGDSQRPGRGDRWTFDDWARRDLPAAIQHVARRQPLFLVGHSAGGAVVLVALAARPELQECIRGAVILATPLPWLQPLRRVFAHGIRLLSLAAGRFPARLLGIGPEDELARVMAQWMTWNLRGSWRGDDGTDYGARLHDVHVPVLAMAGAGDRLWAPPRAVRGLVDLLDSSDRTFTVCGREDGCSRDYDHNGLVISRPARTEVWPRIVEWLDARSGALPMT
ncbi:MAG: alpha/beta fold hydrolase [Gemmatimonadota bacterium]